MTTIGPGGEVVGLTCNSFGSLSLDPPLVSWGLRLNSKNLEAFKNALAFTINILAEDQQDVSARFASSALPRQAKFEGVAWSPGHAGVPVIDDCVAYFECDKFAEHVVGDHLLFIGRVVRFEQNRQEDSLVFYKGAYMMLTQSLREIVASGRVEPENLLEARRLINCMLLRLGCQNGTEGDFDAIEHNLQEIERHVASKERNKRTEASLEFFRLITRAAHNEVLATVSESLTTILRHVMKAAPSTAQFRPELVPARRRILAHLRARDPDAAEREMSNYFEQIRRGQS